MAKLTPDGKHIEGLDAHLYKIVNGKLVEKTKAELAQEQAKEKLEQVHRERAAAYPPIGDQLDAIWKQLNALRMQNKLDLIEEADDMLGKILAVKREIPKE